MQGVVAAEYVVPDVGCTISDALELIELRCRQINMHAHSWRGVHLRLAYVYVELRKVTDDKILRENHALIQYGDTISRFIKLLNHYADRSALYLMARNHKITAAITGFHADVDKLYTLLIDMRSVENTNRSQEWEDTPPGRLSSTTSDSESTVRTPRSPSWFLPSNDIRVDKSATLGRGTYRGSWNDTPVVVKPLIAKDDKSVIAAFEIWNNLDHPNVVQLYGACSAALSPLYVIEHCPNGNFADFFRKHGRSKLWRLFHDAALGLNFIHEQKVVHGNLKCSNLLIGADNRGKVGDLQLAFILTQSASLSAKTQTESIRWKAPECLGQVDEQPSELTPRLESDIYSLGMCIIEAFLGAPPFQDTTDEDVLCKLLCREPHPRPEALKDEEWGFVRQMVAYNWHIRPSLASIINTLREFSKREAVTTAIPSRRCPRCRLEVAGDNKFCAHCGTCMSINDEDPLRSPKSLAKSVSIAETSSRGRASTLASDDDSSDQETLDIIGAERAMSSLIDRLAIQCERLHEAKPLVDHVLQRLEHHFEPTTVATPLVRDISELSKTDRPSIKTITNRLLTFLKTFADKSVAFQLISAQAVADAVATLHRALDLSQGNDAPAWEQAWKVNVDSLKQTLTTRLEGTISQVVAELADPTLQVEALTLIFHEVRHNPSSYTDHQLKLLQKVISHIVSFTNQHGVKVEDWFIPRHEVQFDAVPFAGGSFGRVFHGMWRKLSVVVKCVEIKSEAEKRTFLREVKVWSQARHRHIVPFFGAHHLREPYFIVSEFAPGGSLTDYLYRQRQENQFVVWRKLHEVSLGLYYLHQKGIVHGDLKGNNILMSKDGTAMLTDFGLSFIVEAGTRPHVEQWGAIRWRAPEYVVQDGAGPSFAADVYSLAMCIVEAVTGDAPWGSVMPDVAIASYLRQKRPLRRPSTLSDAEWDLVSAMCTFEPSERMELGKVVEELDTFATEEAEREWVARFAQYDSSLTLLEARGGYLDVKSSLKDHEVAVDAHDNGGEAPLMNADDGGDLDMVGILVERGAAVEADEIGRETLLIRAALGDQWDVVRYLVGNGESVDGDSRYGQMLLECAAGGDHWDIVRLLVNQGAAVDGSSTHGQMLMIRAARSGHLDMARFLVEHGADVSGHDSDGSSALMWAAGGGHLEVVRYLVEQGAAVDDRDIDDWTPLMWAARGGHLEVVRYLVEHGATMDGRNNDGQMLLERAAIGDYWDVVRYLMNCGATVEGRDTNGWMLLVRAALGDHWDVVRYLMKCVAVVDGRDNDGWTLLMRSARAGHWDVVRFLVERGVSVDGNSRSGQTLLVRAARIHHWDIVQYLVKHGVDANGCDSEGLTPLMWAAHDGQWDVVRLLVDHGAAMDSSDNDGWTSLMWASRGGHLNVVRGLVEHGATVDVSSSRGQTPLMLAAGDGHLDMVRYLVEHGAVEDSYSRYGQMLLERAAGGDHWDVVRYLLKRVVAVDSSSSSGQMLLERAACGDHWDVVRFLVKHGVAVDGNCNDGQTPLMWAACGGHLDVVQFLVEHGANPNLKSMAGHTALSTATKFGRQEVVKFLLPLVRYKHRRTQTEHIDDNAARHSNIPLSWLIPPFELEVEPFGDAGNIGGDYRGKWLDADVVIKLFVDDITSATFVDEVHLWHQLRHPNVLKLYGVCNSHCHHLFVCEYASKGSLPEYLRSCGAQHRTPWKFLYEAALGLEYLHERKIVHGNLRGSNILVGSDGFAKLSGFGLNTPSPERSMDHWGDRVHWVAPEILNGEQVSPASDVYSMGMCIIEAVLGKVPFDKWEVSRIKLMMNQEGNVMNHLTHQLARSTPKLRDLVRTMCPKDTRKRLQMPAVVTQLERLAEMEAAKLAQHTARLEPETIVNFDAFDEFNDGKTSVSWTAVQTLIAQSESVLYRQIYHDLKPIHDTLKAGSHSWSTLQRFHDLLIECQHALDTMSLQNRICRLSATRARDHSIQGLHRRITQLLQLVRPQDHDDETREKEWKRLCREQVEIFVSEASEACVLLSSVDSEEDRSALVTVLRAELHNSDGKYTDKQLAVLQGTHDEIVSKSLEDVKLAGSPEWFIPWFELKMSEMKTLGVGGYGSVIKAKWLDSEVVVKKLEMPPKDAANADKKREMRKMFEREVDIWFGLSHPHVVRLFGACHVGRPFFVCELAPNGTLVKYLSDHPNELWSKLREAALGVQYLHARGIVHGDLKGNNILVGSDGKAKVADFGLSGVFGDDSTDVVVSGAWHWVAPECMMKQKPTFASDVYSLGMCIIEALRVAYGHEYTLPWGELPNPAVKFNVTKRHLLPPRPQNCSDEAWTLIKRMCKSAPNDRMLIMTVVDELEMFAGRHADLSDETDQAASVNDEIQLLSLSVTAALAEMQNGIANCDVKQDWESGVLVKIYQFLWNRLDNAATQLLSDGDGTVVTKTAINDFSTLVEHSKERTRTGLGITGVIPLIKFTELALGGYALHRRLDKFMAAHAVSKDESHLHNWTSVCSRFMGVSASLLHPACDDEDCSMNKAAVGGKSTASSTEMAAAS